MCLICFIKWAVRLLSLLDIVDDPLSYFLRSIVGTTFHLNLRGADIGIQTGIDGFTNEGTFLLQAEMLE